jgi:hypothetical protein
MKADLRQVDIQFALVMGNPEFLITKSDIALHYFSRARHVTTSSPMLLASNTMYHAHGSLHFHLLANRSLTARATRNNR